MLSKKTNTQIRLKPGQQAELNDKGTLSVNHTPDIDAIMAWKDDKFVFQKLKLKEIMRQLERWYDIDVLYNNIVSDDEYVGIISRKVKLSEILRLLQSTGSNRFRIQGKTVIVN
jgi:transmembrane sensor